MTELETGAVVASHYVVVSLLGTGGMGVVYRARDTRTNTLCAIKVLRRARGDLATRFIREARIASALAHPNIARVHDVLELEDGTPAIIMELLDGESLGAQIARLGKLDAPTIARTCIAVVAAIKVAHERGVVHRDLKPDNIFLCEDGAVKVLDFGIAKITDSSSDPAITAAALTETGQILGTPQYMAPEQIFGEKDVDARADIWALGVILYQALAGTRPFEGENPGQVFKAIALEPPKSLAERAPQTPRELVDLVERMLTHARADRLADLDEVTRVLTHVSEARPFKSSRSRRRTAAITVTLVCALAIGGAATAMVLRPPPPVPPTTVESSAPASVPPPPPVNASASEEPAEPMPTTSVMITPPPVVSSAAKTLPRAAPSSAAATATSAVIVDAGPRPNRSGPLKRDEF